MPPHLLDRRPPWPPEGTGPYPVLYSVWATSSRMLEDFRLRSVGTTRGVWPEDLAGFWLPVGTENVPVTTGSWWFELVAAELGLGVE